MTPSLPQFPSPPKPSFKFLCVAHEVDPAALARASQLPLLTAIALRAGLGATDEIAQAALSGLNTLKGTHYTLEDISLDLHSREERRR